MINNNINKHKASEAIGMIDQKIIDDAAEKRIALIKGLRKRIIVTATSIAACLTILTSIGAAALSNTRDDNIKVKYNSLSPIVNVSYPKSVPYPDYADYDAKPPYTNPEDNYYVALNKWHRESAERKELYEKAKSTLEFESTVAKELLTESQGENKVFSPLSIYLALSMVAQTADGESKSEILSLLGLEADGDIGEQSSLLYRANYQENIACTSVISNSLWLDKSVRFNRKTVESISKSNFAELFSCDLQSEKTLAAIKEWLNQKTNGVLKDSVEKTEIPENCIMKLYSALYFKSRWSQEFSKSFNKIMDFNTPSGAVQAEFMYTVFDHGPYYWGDDYGAISCPFVDGGKMWFILPDEGKTVDDILKSGEFFDLISNNAQKTTDKLVNVYIPKFDISNDIELADSLQKLGVKSVFDFDKADFSPLFKDATQAAALSRVRHSARIIIDEKGCEAAAFTEPEWLGAAPPSGDVMDFTLDRPFIFAVTNDAGQTLFMGVINNPNEK